MALVGVVRPEEVKRITQVPGGTSIASWRTVISAFVFGDKVSEAVRLERLRNLAIK